MKQLAARALPLSLIILALCGSTTVLEAQDPSFCNSASITINDGSTAATYPSTISVAGMSGTISSVSVSLTGLSESVMSDLGMLLISPGGAKFDFLSDVGGLLPVTGINLTLTDAAPSLAPQSTALGSGSFKPTAYFADTFPVPAPTGPYSVPATVGAATFASVFNGANPNGTWSLYVIDAALGGGNGAISGGWCLNLTTVSALPPRPCCRPTTIPLSRPEREAW